MRPLFCFGKEGIFIAGFPFAETIAFAREACLLIFVTKSREIDEAYL